MFFGKKKGSVSIHFVCTGPLVKYAASFGKGLTSSGWVHGKFRKFQSPALDKSIYITVTLKEIVYCRYLGKRVNNEHSSVQE